jgi:MerR family transcriptional regulator, mercuric resistance operon regulatory protein
MTISQLAKSAGVTAETVRYYQKIGLLRTPQRPGHGYRSYDAADELQLRFIRHGQTLGFSLHEIAALLRLSSANCKEAEQIAIERLASVREKIADLQRLERALQQTVMQCERREPYAGCPLIEALLAR